jgi:hypothetical protein
MLNYDVRLRFNSFEALQFIESKKSETTLINKIES